MVDIFIIDEMLQLHDIKSEQICAGGGMTHRFLLVRTKKANLLFVSLLECSYEPSARASISKA